MVEGEGFEPSKAEPSDLQSDPFGHSGTPPHKYGAGTKSRTRDLLITSQLLYQLSYAGTSFRNGILGKCAVKCKQKKRNYIKKCSNVVFLHAIYLPGAIKQQMQLMMA